MAASLFSAEYPGTIPARMHTTGYFDSGLVFLLPSHLSSLLGRYWALIEITRLLCELENSLTLFPIVHRAVPRGQVAGGAGVVLLTSQGQGMAVRGRTGTDHLRALFTVDSSCGKSPVV